MDYLLHQSGQGDFRRDIITDTDEGNNLPEVTLGEASEADVHDDTVCLAEDITTEMPEVESGMLKV